MTRIATILLLKLLACSMASCQAQSKPQQLDNFVQQKGDSLYKAYKLPGLLVGVLDNGQHHYYSFGYAAPDSHIPFDSAMLFEIGSITKTFTAYVLESVLTEKGISDTAAITPYLPDSVSANKALQVVTFLSLLNHTSGLPRLPDNMDLVSPGTEQAPYDHYTSDHLFAYLKSCSPLTDGKSRYSNLGAGLAGVLAERISGLSYAGLLDKYIFLPFGLVQPGKGIAATEHKAQGYFQPGMKTNYWNMNVMAPAGGLKCSASEILSYLACIAQPRKGVNAAIVEKLLTPTAIVSKFVQVGRGWHMIIKPGQPVIYWHNGGTYGFSTFAAFLKDQSKAVIVVSNRFNSNAATDALGMAIMQELGRE